MISAIVLAHLNNQYKRNEPVTVMILDKVSQPVIMQAPQSKLSIPGAHGSGAAPKTIMRDMYICVEVAVPDGGLVHEPVNGQPYFILPEEIINVNQVSFLHP